MGRYVMNMPGGKETGALLEKLADYVTELEELQTELSDYVEEYMDEVEDSFAEAETYLEEASQEQKVNRLLFRELNACRRELLALLRQSPEHDVRTLEGRYIHHRRLDPDLYMPDPGSAFYIQDPDERFNSMLAGQLAELVWFEEITPMTTAEREALRDHVIRDTGFDPDPKFEWMQFLDKLRSGIEIVVQQEG